MSKLTKRQLSLLTRIATHKIECVDDLKANFVIWGRSHDDPFPAIVAQGSRVSAKNEHDLRLLERLGFLNSVDDGSLSATHAGQEVVGLVKKYETALQSLQSRISRFKARFWGNLGMDLLKSRISSGVVVIHNRDSIDSAWPSRLAELGGTCVQIFGCDYSRPCEREVVREVINSSHVFVEFSTGFLPGYALGLGHATGKKLTVVCEPQQRDLFLGFEVGQLIHGDWSTEELTAVLATNDSE